MIRFIEKIMTYGLFSNGTSIGDWTLDGLYDKKYKSSKQFTYAERHAIEFLEEMRRKSYNSLTNTHIRG